VRRGDIVARVLPQAPALLDARTRTEAAAAVDTATAALGEARANEQRARAALAHADSELGRLQRLTAAGVTTAQQLAAQEADATLARDAATAAAFAVRAAEADVERARARVSAATGGGEAPIAVRAPADGVVLRRLRESEGVVAAAEPLLEIGDPARLEIVTDLLSSDAARVRPGARATIDAWGGEGMLEARVRRVEPSGFTKISALGVEEQRVNVVLDFADAAAAYVAIGDAYRVEVHIVVAESAAALKAPTSALFRRGDAWAVYAIRDGRARETPVQLGLQTGQEAEVRSGLDEGDRVIVHPGDLLTDGARVRERRNGR
jgi:HlyD family secretion protein